MLNLKPRTYWSIAAVIAAMLVSAIDSGLVPPAYAGVAAGIVSMLQNFIRLQSPAEKAEAESVNRASQYPLAFALCFVLASTQLTACAHAPTFATLPSYAMAGLALTCDAARVGVNEAVKAGLPIMTADARLDDIDMACDQAEAAIVQLDGATRRLGALQ